jgi:glycosyltransferase involved in cell wall biosynthesis
MKVLYILEDSRFGGMNKMIIDLCAEFRRKNLLIPHLIIGATDSEVLEKYLARQGVPYSKVPLGVLSKNIPALARYAVSFVPDLLRLYRLIRHLRPDLVYANGSQQIKGVLAAKALGRKTIWHMHDTNQPRVLVGLFRLVARAAGVSGYVSSSERTSRFYQLPAANTLVSLPQVNEAEFVTYADRKPYFEKPEPVVVTVANINPDKGIDTLIHTAAAVQKVRNEVRFKVIGLLPESQKTYWAMLTTLLKDLAINNIEFMGQQTDVIKLLDQADVYLCTSNNESGPLAVFEALAVGLPVVTTDVGDLSRLFQAYNYGAVHPVGAHESLSRELLELLQMPVNLAQKINAGKAIVKNETDLTSSTNRHLAFYQKILHE